MMHRHALLLFALSVLPLYGMAQTVIIDEGFDDGDFTNNPSWTDSESKHIVNSSNLLQLNAPSNTDEAVISTVSTAAYGEWEALIKLDFNPSGSNKARFYLLSNTQNMKGDVTGYYIEIGDTGDEVSLYRQDGSSSTKIIDGTDDLLDTDPVNVRIKATRDVDGNWKLFADTTGGTAFVSQGKATDNTYFENNFIGLFSDYTSTRSTLFEYDNIIVTRVVPPLKIKKVSLPDNNTIDIQFNLDIDPASVSVSDFSLNKGIGNPDVASLPSPNIVRLIYDSLPSNQYILTVNNVNNINGNTIAPNSTASFILYDTFSNGDVVINEFMYDPPTGLPEYVELRNTSSKFLNIKDWQLGDQNGIGTITADTVSLAPGSFLVLSSDTTALFNQFGHRNYLKMSSGSFPSLNNSGDAIRIISGGLALADSLFYAPDWGGEDIALERRSATAPSSKKANWSNSPQGTGTPGISNQVSPDQTPPEFTELQIVDQTTFRLLFSEELDSESAIDVDNYLISPDPGIQLISAGNDTVTLFLAGELQSQQSYEVTVNNLADIFGNVLDEETKEATFVEFSSVQTREIVINEILYTRAAGDGPEFIELYNISDKNFDLSGWEIGDASGTADLTAGTQLLAGEYLVLTDNITLASSVENAQDVPGFPSLNDSGDILFLRTADGAIIDTLNYASAWGGDQRGHSLERKDPLAASNDASNWSTSEAENGNTAGVQNSVFQPDEIPPAIIFAKKLPEGNIEVQLDEFIVLTPDVRFSANGAALTIEEFDSTNANRVLLNAPSRKLKPASAPTSVTAQNLSDVRGNITTSSDIPVAQPLLPSDVVINEIMYNPLDNADDNHPDQSEYVELVNTRDYAVSMEGIFLNDAPDEDGEVRSLMPVSTQAKWIPANGIMLVYADEEPDFKQSRVVRFFDLSTNNISSPIRIDRTTLSLASSGDAIYLSDSTGTTIDSVFYDESWQNPNLIDTRGVALERISPDGPSSDASNWSSSATVYGGTPNTENSIYQRTRNLPEQTGLSFSPNPFSPDDDGSEDNLFINYKLDESDYLLKVHIYDRYGRLVRELADGKQAGFEGSLIWNGRKDDGSNNRIGIYIVVFEAFNSANGKDVAFKKTVVLARRL